MSTARRRADPARARARVNADSDHEDGVNLADVTAVPVHDDAPTLHRLIQEEPLLPATIALSSTSLLRRQPHTEPFIHPSRRSAAIAPIQSTAATHRALA